MLVDICSDIAGVRYSLGTADNLDETARRCRELGATVETMPCDVRDQGQLDAAVAHAIAQLGQIDVLINNAGVGSPAGPVWELSEEQWLLLLDIDLNGVWRTSKAVIPHMIEASTRLHPQHVVIGRPEGVRLGRQLRRRQARGRRPDQEHGDRSGTARDPRQLRLPGVGA